MAYVSSTVLPCPKRQNESWVCPLTHAGLRVLAFLHQSKPLHFGRNIPADPSCDSVSPLRQVRRTLATWAALWKPECQMLFVPLLLAWEGLQAKLVRAGSRQDDHPFNRAAHGFPPTRGTATASLRS